MDARDVFGVTPPSHKRPRNEETPPSADGNGADRLSELPEGLLHLVLSLLPAHEAVRTCVLARHWRHLWRSAPGLLVTDIKGFRSADKLDSFVSQLLLLHRSGDGDARLESCEFSLFDFCFDLDGFLPASAPRLSHWILSALQRQVKVLRVSIWDFEERFQLPHQPLSSHYLTTLNLGNVDAYDSVLDFSGCPALLDLKMSYCHVRAHRISSQSLKHLSMSYCGFYADERTRMSLSSLVSLELIDLSGRAPLLESMPALQTATCTFDYECYDTCDDRMGRFDACGNVICEGCYYNYEPVDDHNECLLLKGLSEATELNLAAVPAVYVFMRDLKWCPTFSKLKTLELGEWCLAAGLDALILFLCHSPILEKLTLHLPQPEEVSKKLMEAEKSYNPLEQSVASGLLQMVKIKCQEVDGMVLRILKMLNASGVPFDKIIVQCLNGRSCSGCFSFVCTDLSPE